MEDINILTEKVLKLVFDVHSALGAGLLESTYETGLFYELTHHNIKVERQKILPICYKNITLDERYRIDLLVEDRLILELKSVDNLMPVHSAQVLTYLKLSKLKYGLLLNFNVSSLKYGIKRFIL